MSSNKIYFCQHGIAIDKLDNAERPLSEEGIQQTQTMTNTLLKSKTPISNIYHSGKLRALQTAEIFASALNLATTTVIDCLSPNDNVTLLAQTLDINSALYIGHLPHLEKLVAYLVTGNENNNIIKFKNSGIVCLLKDDKNYRIEWMLTPELTDHS